MIGLGIAVFAIKAGGITEQPHGWVTTFTSFSFWRVGLLVVFLVVYFLSRGGSSRV